MSTIARDDILDSLVNDYLDHKAAAEKHTDIAAQCAEQIIAKIGEGNSYEVVDGVGVKVTHGAQTINSTRAAEILTAEQYAACFVSSFSAAGARNALPGALVDQCKVTGKPQVRAL